MEEPCLSRVNYSWPVVVGSSGSLCLELLVLMYVSWKTILQQLSCFVTGLFLNNFYRFRRSNLFHRIRKVNDSRMYACIYLAMSSPSLRSNNVE